MQGKSYDSGYSGGRNGSYGGGSYGGGNYSGGNYGGNGGYGGGGSWGQAGLGAGVSKQPWLRGVSARYDIQAERLEFWNLPCVHITL